MKRLRATGIMARAGAVPFWGLLGAVLAIPLLAGPVGVQQPLAQRGGELPVTAVRQIEELLAGPAGAQQPPVRAGGEFPENAVRQIEARLAAKAQRTAAQRRVSSQLLDAAESAQRLETEGIAQRLETEPAVAARQQAAAPDADAEPERVTVDIRADVTPAVLARIRTLGGTVINSVPKYRAIRAQLPLASVARLAARRGPVHPPRR